MERDKNSGAGVRPPVPIQSEVDMATTKKTKAKRAAERKAARELKASARPASAAVTALALLEQDHREVEDFFDEYEGLDDDEAKSKLATKICLALKVHTQIEEEIFYPAARKATKDDDLLDEATVEHAGAKELISQIESMDVGDDLYDAKVKVLGEQIKHHVEEEEDELFPEVETAGMEIETLGKKLAARKSELMTKLAGAATVDRAAAGDKPSKARSRK
jgi:hemerythrin superfamily protein